MAYTPEVRRSEELAVNEQQRAIAAANQNASIARIVRIIYFAFSLLEVLLAVRIVFRMLAANPSNPFAALVYAISFPFVVLFNSLFTNPAFGSGVFELTTIVAMIVYAVIAWIIARIVWLILSRPR